ncbi:hypothetical protein FB451DRAFT_137298 [Mycena latifolia]|nr:hypothetical protein FB451DRAFT_137298 [Mycena latifolia]
MHAQGVNSPTFSPAPLDCSLTFPQLLEHHLAYSPNHTAYIYDDPQGNTISVSFARYITTVHAGCRRVLREVLPIRNSDNGKGLVVGILATTDTISYCMLVAAVMRAGMVPFCLSPRSAPESLATLLLQTETPAVYVSQDSLTQDLLSEALELCGTQVSTCAAPTFEALQGEAHSESEALPPIQAVAFESTALILHSSGSTSIFSKPIYVSHTILLQYAGVPWSSTEDHCGQIVGTHNFSNFHGIGLFIGTWPFTTGLIMAILRPTIPPMPPTPENALTGIRATKPDLVLAPPASIEAWSEDPAGIEAMKSLKALSYIGAPLSKRTGDTLVSKGVVLCSAYGSLETGLVTPFFQTHGKDWDYFSVRTDIEAVRVPEDDDSEMYTHTYLVSPTYATCYTNTEIGGRPGCALSDLLEPHPEKPDLHRIHGRKDNLIALSIAAKMNPVPIEACIKRNSLVDAVVVFGHGRTHPGMLVQLKPEFQPDLLEAKKRAKVVDTLWESVEEANSSSPTHFQISKAMIVLADPRKPFALTSKLEPRKKVVLEHVMSS